MPFKPAENPKCPKCSKSVYAAEERVAGGHKYHKGCFKCGMCQKFLDSTNCAEHEAELYCKNCHGRKYGPKGYGFGGGAGCLSMDSGEQFKPAEGEVKREPRPIAQAPEGEGCPRCGGFVYAAEQMLARGRGYHRRCFKCVNCNRTLDSVMHCDAPDGRIYCKGCFKCFECNKGLDSRNCCEGPTGEIYCKTHYGQKFGPKGYGYGQGGGALQSDDYANGETHAPKTTVVDTAKIKAPEGQGCPRCGGAVFAAELVLAKGSEWHRKCFKCHDCRKTLDSIIACDGPDKDVYCRTCYGKRWGPHGYGFACGSGFLQTDGTSEEELSAGRPFVTIDTTRIKAQEGQGCPRCGGAVFAAEQMLAKGTMWHKKCFSCAECKRPLDSVLACDGPDKEIHCKGCYAKLFGPKGFGYGSTPVLSTNGETTLKFSNKIGGAKPTDGTGCPRCGFVVYEAEKMISKTSSWHKRCFNCADCHKSLDSTNLCDSPHGEIYCRGCYGRLFGPRGVGFGMGAGVLSMV